MDFKVVFDRDHLTLANHGRTAFSDIIYIPPGTTALLSLYNMVNELDLVKDENGKFYLSSDDCAVIHKISLGPTGDVARRVECGEKVDVLGELRKLLCTRRMFHEPVYQCGSTWTLNPSNNFAMIPTPGYYVIEVLDANQFDTAYIEYALLNVSDSLAIPDEFKLGG